MDNLQIRVTPELGKEFEDALLQYSDVYKTKGAFLGALLEAFQNPKGISVEMQKEIEFLKAEKERVVDEMIQHEQRSIQFEGQCINLSRDLEKVEQERDNLLSMIDNSKLTPNQVLINFEAHVMYFINDILERYKEAGKPTTAEKLIKNLFWSQIKNGPGDHLPKYSDSHIFKVIDMIKRQHKQRLEAQNV